MTSSSDPTPAEIAKRAAAIRAEWTDREFARRAGVDPRAEVKIPIVRDIRPELRP